MNKEEAVHIVDVAFNIPQAVRRIGEDKTYHEDEIREAKNMAIKALEQIPDLKEAYNKGYKDGQEALAVHLELCKDEGSIIEIPKGATNGDMIKALFPNVEFDNAMPFTDNRWETMNLNTNNKTKAIYKPTQLRVYADWWNSPYRKE